MRRIPARLAALLLLLTGTLGCDPEELPTAYGSRSGADANSVNGTSVLADMFAAAGHRVSSTSWLAPRVRDRAEVIVWFPNDFDVPTEKVRDWLDAWLAKDRGRTLVYVGRDYDAAPEYWRSVLAEDLSEEQRKLAEKELKQAEALFDLGRATMQSKGKCDWFSQKKKARHRDVHELASQSPWSSDVDAAELGIELNSRMQPAPRSELLLAAGPDMLVSRHRSLGSQVIVVANGSFLLNLPLVNHEHRKLAGRLVDAVGQDKRVVFLESGASGPTIFEEDPANQHTSGLAILGTDPFDIPLVHLAWAGVVFCLARYPIFGRPREWVVGQLSDFGAHVTALGKLLQRTKDRTFAAAALDRYRHALTSTSARPAPAKPPVIKPPVVANPLEQHR